MEKPLLAAPRIAVVLPSSAKSNRDKLAGVFQYIRLHTPWQVRLIDRECDSQTVASIHRWRPSGIILGRLLEKFGRELDFGVPTIVMDAPRACYGALLKRASFITCDQRLVAEAGADYLARQGFVRLAYLANAPCDWSVERGRLFQDWSEMSGLFCPVHISSPNGRVKRSADWFVEQDRLLRWLKSLPKQTAVFVSNDRQARELLDLCQLARLRVPSDIAVLGCDNDELLCENTLPALSSVEPDFTSCGYRAAELLDRSMSQKIRKPQQFFYGVKRIVERESTRFHSSADDVRICRGLEFIRLNAARRIGVCDVAKHMHVSRRMAEILFRKQRGRSINSEIQLVRIDRLKSLLLETDKPINALCEQCGYRNEAHVKNLFKRMVGSTMSQFRSSRKGA
ncbi:MAG TPA: substrate-binding domain-containing protein [Kiritimatiellia bacterium]|nr:substrate-binding domain-containing protein [Kiritimatiellia bacterium]